MADEGIPVNMTLCFTVPQAILAARAGARYISPFVGRFDDISEDGLAQLDDVVRAIGNYDFSEDTVNGEQIEIIAASIRSANHVTQAALMGADIATVPFGILKKCVQHPLTDRGLESFPHGLGESAERMSDTQETMTTEAAAPEATPRSRSAAVRARRRKRPRHRHWLPRVPRRQPLRPRRRRAAVLRPSPPTGRISRSHRGADGRGGAEAAPHPRPQDARSRRRRRTAAATDAAPATSETSEEAPKPRRARTRKAASEPAADAERRPRRPRSPRAPRRPQRAPASPRRPRPPMPPSPRRPLAASAPPRR
ncbi:MAG: transaldolase family protein [Adlercreutzia equolifaciens]